MGSQLRRVRTRRGAKGLDAARASLYLALTDDPLHRPHVFPMPVLTGTMSWLEADARIRANGRINAQQPSGY